MPPFEGTIEFVRKDVAPKATAIPDDPGPASAWASITMRRSGIAATWRGLTADRLLYNFRANAGLPVGSVEPLGGWEQQDNRQRASELRGHFTGHFLSASAQLSASTGDKEAKAKGDYMVAELAKCQEKLGGGYLSAFPTTFGVDRLDKMRAPELPWAPFYTIHKIMAGMLDMYQLAGNKQALQVLEGMAGGPMSGALPNPKSTCRRSSTPNTAAWRRRSTIWPPPPTTIAGPRPATASPRRASSIRWPRAATNCAALHVNTHIPQVIGAARRYEISGDMRFHDVADYFWYEVSTARSYVTGGTSNGEGWLAQPRQLAAELKRSVATAECCCAYNMLKLARHLYSWNPRPALLRLLRALAAESPARHDPAEDRLHAVLPLAHAGRVEDLQYRGSVLLVLHRHPAWRNTPSSTTASTGATAKACTSICSSRPSWTGRRRDSSCGRKRNIPSSQHDADRDRGASGPMAMRLRIPAGSSRAPTVKINGRALDASAAPGSYLTLNRVWKAGDKIEMELPMHLRVEAMPDDPKMQAFLYGPLVLAGRLGQRGSHRRQIVGPNAPRMGAVNPNAPVPPNAPPRVPEIDIPAFTAAGPDPASWIKPADKPLTFRTTGQKRDVTLVPLNSLFARRYSVYWKVS